MESTDNKERNQTEPEAEEALMSHSPQTAPPATLQDSDKPIAAIREDDEYRRFREKRKMSKKKIKGFFGESVHVDISVSVIEKKGLSAIMQSNVPLCYFLHALLEDMNAENLFFYLEVEQFEEHEFQTVKVMRKTAMELYNAFVKAGADFEVNLEAKIRDSILPKIENGDQNCFAEAREHVVHLLIPCFSNFTLGPIYDQMVKDLGENTTLYGKEQRNRAIKALLEYIDKDPSSVILADDKSARRRRLLLRELVHSFCRTRLRCDFKDKEAARDESKKRVKKASEEAMAYAT
jgi:hypothetical protein